MASDYPGPGPWVDPAPCEAAPWRSHAGIVTFIELVVPLPAMSPRDFHLYWQNHHSMHVMNVTPFSQFMRKYSTAHCTPAAKAVLPGHYRQDHPFAGAAQVWLNALAEVPIWLGHPLYPELIAPDEARFIDVAGPVEVALTKQEVLIATSPDFPEAQGVKIMLIARKPADRESDAFHAAASDHGKAIAACPSLRAMLRKLAVSHKLDEALADFPQADIDAVFELWFDDAPSASAFFAHPDYVGTILPAERDHLAAREILALCTRVQVIHDELSFQPSLTQPHPLVWE
jgi:hypothetical protein